MLRGVVHDQVKYELVLPSNNVSQRFMLWEFPDFVCPSASALTWSGPGVQEDEAYDMQFGEAFEAQALDPNDRRSVLRDDYAMEIADMDE